MAIDIPWILAQDFLNRIVASGLEKREQAAALTICEIIRSTRPMPQWALAPGPAELQIVRYALPEVRRLDRPLDCRTLDIPTSTIEVAGKMFGDFWAMPGMFRTRVEFWTADVERLFPVCAVKRGAKPKYDWDVGEASIRKMLDKRGDPTDPRNAAPGWNSKSSITEALIECLTPRNGGGGPAFESARTYARKILKKWQEDQSG